MFFKGGYDFSRNVIIKTKNEYGFLLKDVQKLVKGERTLKLKEQGSKIINLKKIIIASQFNKTINVYNGQKWLPILITSQKVGRRYKDFVLTKRMGSGIHRVIKKKK